MNFPLYVETYKIDGRIYRRNPFQGFRSDREAELRGGDTADLYADNYDKEDYYDAEESYDGSGYLSEVSNQSTSDSSEIDESDLLKKFGGAFESDQEMKENRLKSDEDVELGIIKYNEKSKKWSVKIDVPLATRRFLIGHKGVMKRKTEDETECRLIFPGKSKKNRPIEIVSMKAEENIERCRDRIQLMIINARDKAPYTHFVSVPMNHQDLQTTFSHFVEFVQNDDELPDNCRDVDLFNLPTKLHLTLVMLSLLDEKEKECAAAALTDVIQNKIKGILDGKGFEIEMRGLDYMNDDPTHTNVVYACAHSEKLSEVASCIANAMIETGLAPRQDDQVKMHMTLMNTTYAFRKSGKKIKMNVKKLMEKYGEFFFGLVHVNELHISSCYDSKTDSGYYGCIAKVPLNN